LIAARETAGGGLAWQNLRESKRQEDHLRKMTDNHLLKEEDDFDAVAGAFDAAGHNRAVHG